MSISLVGIPTDTCIVIIIILPQFITLLPWCTVSMMLCFSVKCSFTHVCLLPPKHLPLLNASCCRAEMGKCTSYVITWYHTMRWTKTKKLLNLWYCSEKWNQTGCYLCTLTHSQIVVTNWGARDAWSSAPQLMSCNWFVGSWPLFIIDQLYDDLPPSRSRQFAYKNFGC